MTKERMQNCSKGIKTKATKSYVGNSQLILTEKRRTFQVERDKSSGLVKFPMLMMRVMMITGLVK